MAQGKLHRGFSARGEPNESADQGPRRRRASTSPGDPASRDVSCGVRRSYCRTRYRGGLLMRSVTYSMGVSLDGYITGPDGDITAPPPDEEVWRLVTDEIREGGGHLMGRRLYETML